MNRAGARAVYKAALRRSARLHHFQNFESWGRCGYKARQIAQGFNLGKIHYVKYNEHVHSALAFDLITRNAEL